MLTLPRPYVMSDIVLRCNNIFKTYNADAGNILANFNLAVAAGEGMAIMGRSGSGKTTLLQILAGLDHPDSGTVLLNGLDYHSLDDRQLSVLRNEHLGFIYQSHNLLKEFTAVENVMLPLLIANKVTRKEARGKSEHLLEKVGMQHRINYAVTKLSGGECQRVAIARSLINNPSCILADEPTGSLDVKTAAIILELMQQVITEHNTALVVVTHDPSVAKGFKLLELGT